MDNDRQDVLDTQEERDRRVREAVLTFKNKWSSEEWLIPVLCLPDSAFFNVSITTPPPEAKVMSTFLVANSLHAGDETEKLLESEREKWQARTTKRT